MENREKELMDNESLQEGLLKIALKRLGEGYSILPIGIDKLPLGIRWKEDGYQDKQPSGEQMVKWFVEKQEQITGLAMVCGRVSQGRFVVDFDGHGWRKALREFVKAFPMFNKARSVSTATGKVHLHARCNDFPADVTKLKRVGENWEIEFRGNRTLTTIPPSRTDNGIYDYRDEQEEFVVGIEIVNEVIRWMKEGKRTESPVNEKKPWVEEVLPGVKDGGRNDAAKQLAGRYAAKGLTEEEAINAMNGWDKGNKPPLGQEVIARTVKSIYGMHKNNHPVVEPVEDENVEQDLDLTLPRDVIQGVASDFINLFSGKLESPFQFFAFSFFTILGNIKSKVRLSTLIDTSPRLYTVILGESADARKSEAIKQTRLFFEGLEYPGFNPIDNVNSGEGLIKEMAKSPQIVLIYDEFNTFVSKAGIENATLLPTVTSLFDQGRAQTLKVKDTDSSRVTDGRLSILGACTTDTFNTMFSSKYLGIGFINRLLLVPGDSKRSIASPGIIDPQSVTEVRKKLLRNMDLFPDGTFIDMDPVAKFLWDSWYKSDAMEGEFAKRLSTYGMRLMVLFCISEGTQRVTEDIVRRIIAICNWEKRVRTAYAPEHYETFKAKVESAFKKSIQSGKHSKGRIMSQSRAYKRWGVEDSEKIFKTLIDNKVIVLIPGKGYYLTKLNPD